MNAIKSIDNEGRLRIGRPMTEAECAAAEVRLALAMEALRLEALTYWDRWAAAAADALPCQEVGLEEIEA